MYEKKLAMKQALQGNSWLTARLVSCLCYYYYVAFFIEGRTIPKDLKEESEQLAKELAFDPNVETPWTHVDDEYATATLADPKIMITTSRDPSSRLIQFSKELSLIFPNSQRLNRGNYVLPQLVQTCKDNDVTDLILVHEHRGVPDGLIVCHLPYGPTAFFSLFNVTLRHDVKKELAASEDEKEQKMEHVSLVYPHLIFNQFASKLGLRVCSILKHLFPIPKPESKRVITFSNDGDYISFRHHNYIKDSHRSVSLREIGPRFELRLYEIKLGTIDVQEADTEWVLRPYMNSSRKRDML